MSSSRTPDPALSAVRRGVKRTLFNVGYYHRRLLQLDFRGVAILCYHGIRAAGEETPFRALHVTEDTFDRHCRLLSQTCTPISLEDFRAARAGTRALPERPVMVTFDDGYRGVLERGLPVLERYGVSAAVFACAHPVLQSRHFWFDVICRRDGEAAVAKARTLPYGEWRTLVQSIDTPADACESHRPLTRSELQRLAVSPLITIGGHTMSHPTLACASAAEQRREIGDCREALRQATGTPVDAFAYPYGDLNHDYLPETVNIVREVGFELAFTTHESFAALDGDPFQIPRFMMLDSVGDDELAHRLLHSWHAQESGV